MKFASLVLTALTAMLLVTLGLSACSTFTVSSWTPQEQEMLAALSLASLPPLPQDPSNAVADNKDAANLGHALFFEKRLSPNDGVSCATCHDPVKGFTDGLPQARGLGTTTRHTPSVIGAAYSPWLAWDGRKDSLWAQALLPLEHPLEQGSTRGEVAQVVAQAYGPQYRQVFGPLPPLGDSARFPAHAGPLGDAAAQVAWTGMAPEDREAVTRVFVNVGKAIGAFQRELSPEPGRFDAYVGAVQRGDVSGERVLTPDEVAGLKLFVGEAGCVRCHSGPRLTDDTFHNTGVPVVAGLPPDSGREAGAKLVLEDEFNCLSRYSDADPSTCLALKKLAPLDPTLERAFKVPSLRQVASGAPYMHAGQFSTLEQVLAHYNRAPAAPSGATELEPLGLSDTQLRQLEAFLTTLGTDGAAP